MKLTATEFLSLDGDQRAAQVRAVDHPQGPALAEHPEHGQTHRLELVQSTVTPSGVTLQSFRPAGRATFGTAGG